MSLIDLYELLFDVEALPRTWNPIKLAKRRTLKETIMNRINAELAFRISEKNSTP